MERYGGLTSQLGASFVFVPILVDTFGAFGASAIPWITRAAVLAGRRFSVHPSQAIPLAFQRLSSTLIRALVNIAVLTLTTLFFFVKERRDKLAPVLAALATASRSQPLLSLTKKESVVSVKTAR